MPIGRYSEANTNPGRKLAPTGPTEGPAAPLAPAAFDGGWARTTFSSELTPEEQRQRDSLMALSAAQTARENTSGTAKRWSAEGILGRGTLGSGTWSCWRCGSSNGGRASKCYNCRAVPLKAGTPTSQSSNRDGGRDGPARQIRHSDQNLAQNWRHINLKTRESVPKTSQNIDSAAPQSVLHEYSVNVTVRSNSNDHLHQMRLQREETTKDGRYVGLSPQGRQLPERELSSPQNSAISSQPDSSPLNNNEGHSRGRQVPEREASNPQNSTTSSLPDLSPLNNEEGHSRGRQVPEREASNPQNSTTSTLPDPSPLNIKEGRSRGRQVPEREASNPQNSTTSSLPDPSPLNNKEGHPRGLNITWTESSGANFPGRPPPPEPHIMAAPASSSESSENVPQEAESKSWTRWTPLESHEQPSQPGQSSPPKTPSVLDDIRSEPTNAGRDQQREDISYNKTRRRAGDFDIEPPIQSAEYELNRFDRDRNRPKRSRQFVQEYDEEEDYVAKRADRKRQRKKDKAVQRAAAPPTPIILPEFISIANLASALRVRTEDFARKMTELGFEEAGTDHVLDAETAGLIATEFNFEPIVDRTESEDLQARPQAEDKSSLPPRPPVVTIMGHVDHGKTTLLDWLRKSSVAASEHGGITQHIGAFSVSMPSGRMITFLDTPGHAAFLSMRQRGANVTDIVILVVAADDSVKPQTIEAIHHAKAAKVPIIVAVNKIDKEDANVERVKLDLGRHGIEVEDFGGDTQVVCVSGKTGQGMDELEDAALALADILDMRAETDGPAEGWVLEATTKKAGRVATVLVRRGTMHPGDVIVAGNTWARVRSLRNEAGMQVPSAGPGSPVEVDGWREQPAAGDEVLQAPDEQKAKSVVEWRLELTERIQLASDVAAVNETRRLEQEKREREDQSATTGVDGEEAPAPPEPASAGVKEVFFIVKADVSGSVEAVLNSISALGNSEVRAHVLRSGVGTVTEFDVEHAAAAKGHVLAFNTVVDVNISRMAEAAGVGVLESNIIYRLIEDVRAILEEQLPPLTFQKVVGEAEVAQVFEISVKGRVTMPVAGCRVRNGVMTRNSKVRVLRDKEAVFDGMVFKPRFCCLIHHPHLPTNLSDIHPPSPFSRCIYLPLKHYSSLASPRYYTKPRVLHPTAPLFLHLLTRLLPQEPSPRSDTSKRTSPKCARAPNAASASRTGPTSKLATRCSVTRRRPRSGLSEINIDNFASTGLSNHLPPSLPSYHVIIRTPPPPPTPQLPLFLPLPHPISSTLYRFPSSTPPTLTPSNPAHLSLPSHHHPPPRHLTQKLRHPDTHHMVPPPRGVSAPLKRFRVLGAGERGRGEGRVRVRVRVLVGRGFPVAGEDPAAVGGRGW